MATERLLADGFFTPAIALLTVLTGFRYAELEEAAHREPPVLLRVAVVVLLGAAVVMDDV